MPGSALSHDLQSRFGAAREKGHGMAMDLRSRMTPADHPPLVVIPGRPWDPSEARHR